MNNSIKPPNNANLSINKPTNNKNSLGTLNLMFFGSLLISTLVSSFFAFFKKTDNPKIKERRQTIAFTFLAITFVYLCILAEVNPFTIFLLDQIS